jgi:hypothetical protein
MAKPTRRFDYIALIGISVLGELVNIAPARAAVTYTETFSSAIDRGRQVSPVAA